MKAKDLLRDLAIRANNTVMKGAYSGDDIHEASELMRYCILILEALKNGKEESGTSQDTAGKD